MDAKQAALDIIKKHGVACAVELISGPIVDELLLVVENAIPGQIDNVVIETLKPAMKAKALELLQAL